MLADIYDSVVVTADGVDRLKPREHWRPYIVAAMRSAVRLASDRKTGLEPAVAILRVREGGLDVVRRAA